MKNRIIALILAIFLGNFGIHKFYIGNPNAWKYLLFGLIIPGSSGIIGLIQGIKYLLMSDKEFELLVMKESGWIGKKMVQQIRINDQLNTFQTAIPQTIKYEFPDGLFNKLNMFSLDILAIVNMLKTNPILLNECSNNPGKISDYMCYDMVQIFGMLYGANFDNAKLESFSCFMLLPNANSELVRTKSYTELANDYQSKKYEQAIKDTISYYINYDNPLLILSENTTFALPNILKKIDRKLFEHYTNILYNYANFLITANGLATIEEQKAVNQIYNLIYG